MEGGIAKLVAKFRLIRIKCHITAREVAEAANISPQRLNQYETRYYGTKPRNPEKLIKALETVIQKRKKAIITAEQIFMNDRDSIFDYFEKESELL